MHFLLIFSFFPMLFNFLQLASEKGARRIQMHKLYESQWFTQVSKTVFITGPDCG